MTNFKIAVVICAVVLLNTHIARAEERMEIIKLPKPRLKGKISVEEAIYKRRSVRSYVSKGLSREEVSQLVWAAQGVTSRNGLRSAPSAGALYPLEVYALDKDGFYHYDPAAHALEKKSAEDLRAELAKAALGQHFVEAAPFDMIICAVSDRISSKYGERGKRYTDIEVGHAAENVHLQAVALGLSSVPVGAFRDEEVSRVLNLPKDEIPVYIIPIGYKK